MSKWKGKNFEIEIFGESHSKEIGVSASGLPKFSFSKDELVSFLSRRQGGGGVYATPRREDDLPVFSKNADNGLIDGDFKAIIENKNVRSGDYSPLYGKPRPSHADYCWFIKDGALDFSGGGRFSARLTAPFCVLGGILKQYLEKRGVRIHAYLSEVGKVKGRSYLGGEITEEEIVKAREFPSLSCGEEMLKEIAKARENGDSVGGIAECIVFGAPKGLGDSTFDGLEGKISSLCFSIPAVKGVEFGRGFALGNMLGSEANDAWRYIGDEVVAETNNAGGINGGISNGMDITMRVAFRPTPSISREQRTVDLVKKENTTIKITGRHDACVAVRALPVVESAVAIAIADEISGEENE